DYSVEHIDKVCVSLREEYGNCVKVTGLVGRPDMLFVFEAGEVERVFRGEDAAPHRHGESWAAFRTKVSRVALSAGAAAQYTVPVADVADSLGCFDAPEGSESQRLIDAVHTFFISVGELELRAPCHVEKALAECQTSGTSKSLLQDLVSAAGPRVAAVAALDMFLLSLRPEVQERLYEEINTVLQGRPMKPGDVSQMPMYPVVIGNGRQLTKDTVICGYNIPKGTQVIFQHYVMGNSEENFTNASEFRPERWTQRPPGQKHHAFASLPFGFGKRMCLGRRFAELEIHTE
ncbi:Uncharacterized protein OBRU01_11806, partial [Operophtera brumata]